ncbi:hypothetical protein ASPVEDRAFT_22856 [Aspergillus versicolor CBS 583.65]|uniref:Uncharacterized protein n=1 Tax=Aspergillus versicolor CBS 583.65 TaxID=1036611 RepID=A0A1L9P2P8_ASPVE|nr:uncharacterized protein ASPVEDRAFT_22856 [Aspergillus versicolor CBS 583.65]OJI95820.1 hypothetical protein ASPVEDRAFT_22856 [Aspergillus versicolor CBS 583.65]
MWEAVLWTSTWGSPHTPRPSQTICYLDVKDDGWATYIDALVVAYTSAQVWGTILVGLESGLPTLDTAGLKRLRRGHPQSSPWSGCAGGRSTSGIVCRHEHLAQILEGEHTWYIERSWETGDHTFFFAVDTDRTQRASPCRKGGSGLGTDTAMSPTRERRGRIQAATIDELELTWAAGVNPIAAGANLQLSHTGNTSPTAVSLSVVIFTRPIPSVAFYVGLR